MRKQVQIGELKGTLDCPLGDLLRGGGAARTEAKTKTGGGEPRRRVAVCVHGLFSSHTAGFWPEMARFLALDIHVLRMDLAGCGGSGGSKMLGGYERDVRDIEAMMAYCEEEEKMDVVALIGHSKGGNEVLMYAAGMCRVPLVVAIAPRYDMKAVPAYLEDMVAQGQVPQEELDERTAIEMDAVVARIKHETRVLLVHGTADEIIPFADAEAMAVRFRETHHPSFELLPVDGANHFFNASQTHVHTIITAIRQALGLKTGY